MSQPVFFVESPFYVNLHVSNQSPVETVFYPVTDSPESGFHLNPGTAMNIKENVVSGSPVTYTALRGDNHKPLLLNDRSQLTVIPDRNMSLNTRVNITAPEGMRFIFKVRKYGFARLKTVMAFLAFI